MQFSRTIFHYYKDDYKDRIQTQGGRSRESRKSIGDGSIDTQI